MDSIQTGRASVLNVYVRFAGARRRKSAAAGGALRAVETEDRPQAFVRRGASAGLAAAAEARAVAR